MFSLVYISNSAYPFESEELLALASHAAQKNAALAVTGYLYYQNGRFLQYLEGEETIVRILMRAIEEDDRHRVRKTVYLGEQDGRLFSGWSMRYLQQDEMVEIKIEHLLEQAIDHMANLPRGQKKLNPLIFQILQSLVKIHQL